VCPSKQLEDAGTIKFEVYETPFKSRLTDEKISSVTFSRRGFPTDAPDKKFEGLTFWPTSLLSIDWHD
jgi:hypothetical protein